MAYQSKKSYNNQMFATFETLTDEELEQRLAKA